MMSNYRKNLMVGVAVLASLVLLGYMLLKFGAAPAKLFSKKRMNIELRGVRADGIGPGSNVSYLGVSVGQIDSVRRSPDNTEVVIIAALDEADPPPANIIGRIHSQLIGGGGMISLETKDGGAPQGKLAPGTKLRVEFVGTDLLPPEIGALATELRLTAKQFRDSQLIDHLDQTLLSVKSQVEHVGKVIDSLDRTLNDETMKADLRASLANIRTVTETAKTVTSNLDKFTGNLDKLGGRMNTVADDASATLQKTQAHIDQIAKQIDDRMLQVAKLLESFQSISGKIDAGKGTAGMLVNDGKLYESLVSTARELNLTITDLKRLVQQWEQEGVYIKLNK